MNNEEEEVNQLEYRPSFQREERERTAWNIPQLEGETESPNLPDSDEIGGGLVSDIIKDVDRVEAILDKKLEELTQSLKGETIPINDYQKEDVERAKEELELEGEDLTFSDYIEALDKWETPAGDFLVETIERNIEGVNGNIQMELFQDYYELKKEYSLLQKYIQRNLSKILTGGVWEPTEEGWAEKLLRKEKEWGEKKSSNKLVEVKRKNSLQNAFLYNQDNIAAERRLQYEEEKEKVSLENEYARMYDTSLISQSKAREVEKFLQQAEVIENSVWDSTSKELVTQALSNLENDKDEKQGLTQSALMLTLAVENRNGEKHHLKHALRNTYSPSKQERILDELSLYQTLYDEETLPLLHSFRMYDEEPSKIVSSFLNSVTSAMGDIDKEKKKRTLDWQNMQMSTIHLRSQKIKEVEEKEKARQGYQLIRSIEEEG